LVTAPGEQKELEELRFFLVNCCQQFDDFFGLVGGNNLLRVLPICLFERPRNFLWLKKMWRKSTLFATSGERCQTV
jgi:hypothetical protein